jgi:hypothetical protein
MLGDVVFGEINRAVGGFFHSVDYRLVNEWSSIIALDQAGLASWDVEATDPAAGPFAPFNGFRDPFEWAPPPSQ